MKLRMFAFDVRSCVAFRVLLALAILMDCVLRLEDVLVFQCDRGLCPRMVVLHYWWAFPAWPALHLANSSAQWALLLLLAQAMLAVLFLVGWRTRTTALASWWLLTSLHHRNPYVLHPADTHVRVLLFWAIWLKNMSNAKAGARRLPPALKQAREDSQAGPEASVRPDTFSGGREGMRQRVLVDRPSPDAAHPAHPTPTLSPTCQPNYCMPRPGPWGTNLPHLMHRLPDVLCALYSLAFLGTAMHVAVFRLSDDHLARLPVLKDFAPLAILAHAALFIPGWAWGTRVGHLLCRTADRCTPACVKPRCESYPPPNQQTTPGCAGTRAASSGISNAGSNVLHPPQIGGPICTNQLSRRIYKGAWLLAVLAVVWVAVGMAMFLFRTPHTAFTLPEKTAYSLALHQSCYYYPEKAPPRQALVASGFLADGSAVHILLPTGRVGTPSDIHFSGPLDLTPEDLTENVLSTRWEIFFQNFLDDANLRYIAYHYVGWWVCHRWNVVGDSRVPREWWRRSVEALKALAVHSPGMARPASHPSHLVNITFLRVHSQPPRHYDMEHVPYVTTASPLDTYACWAEADDSQPVPLPGSQADPDAAAP
mmetsp:Transcript_51531/g.129293  ORF Transcript_51531/g.129293 Transcript_51531/m.129293 type:complete len:594 (+) Transcript_51531:244-2025(+)